MTRLYRRAAARFRAWSIFFSWGRRYGSASAVLSGAILLIIGSKEYPMLKAAHPHRSYHNLKAYQTASDLCADLFWRSRSFPARLQNSLTVPLRDQAFRVYKSVLRSWKYRNEEQHIGTCIDRALDD